MTEKELKEYKNKLSIWDMNDKLKQYHLGIWYDDETGELYIVPRQFMPTYHTTTIGWVEIGSHTLVALNAFGTDYRINKKCPKTIIPLVKKWAKRDYVLPDIPV